MAIDFSCSSCQKSYRVKDELAGKTAQCSACSEKMHIPELVSAASESGLNLGDLNLGDLDLRDLDVRDLIDDELPTAASATLTPAVTTKCKTCGAPLSLDAVLCIVCGFDKRLGEILETESEWEFEKSVARGTADFLKRGGAISFLGAMLGAAIWFGLAIVAGIGVYVGYPAILVGALAGLGMSHGYNYGQEKTAPPMIAGLIASIMAMAGVFAAKGLIFDHFREAAVVIVGEQAEASVEIVAAVSFESMAEMFGIFELLFALVAAAAAYALARGDHAMETDTA